MLKETPKTGLALIKTLAFARVIFTDQKTGHVRNVVIHGLATCRDLVPDRVADIPAEERYLTRAALDGSIVRIPLEQLHAVRTV